MTNRSARARAWGIIAIFTLFVGVGLALAVRAHIVRASIFELGIAFAIYPIVGAIIIAYRPGNAIGRILVAIGVGTAVTFFSAGYTNYSAAYPGHPLPGAPLVDWMGNLVWPLNIGLGLLLLGLFPAGRPPSPRWRWAYWLGAVGILLNAVSSAFTPGQFSGETTSNPLGLAALQPVLAVANLVSGALLALLGVTALLAVIWRFWRSRGVEREQMKWFAFGAALMVVAIAINMIWFPDSNLGFAIGFGVLPFTVGIAVLRYHLYDIDLLINRALVYGSLTAALAAIYFGAVLGSQALTQALTGHGQPQQPIVIVLTTLLIAALFQPLRSRLQRMIDRRFYRHKYDSARTLQVFGQTLRTEVEMERLCDRLVDVVDETMRPAHVSLWLRAHDGHRAESVSV